MRGLIALIAGMLASPSVAAQSQPPGEWRLAIHGGAGVITSDTISPEQESQYNAALDDALQAGAAILSAGGSAIDAVEAAVVVMEDNPLFNAGVGAVYTAERAHELDASIMSGARRNAGSVAGVTRVRNPIRAARAVMDASPHVMFGGEGADAFAEAQGLAMVDNSHFDTPTRLEAVERVLETRTRTSADKAGTVGAVAIDQAGDLAAATSTGGMTAKARGRIGDSPLIGAATYAENGVCAVTSTGHGEYFIRVGVAKTICDRAKLAGDSVGHAAEATLDEVAVLGGDGGVVAMGGAGEVAMVFNSPGMYRGVIDANGRSTAIYGGD